MWYKKEKSWFGWIRGIMKSIKRKLLECVVNISEMATKVNVNSTCTFLLYQPKVPKEAEKLKKHA